MFTGANTTFQTSVWLPGAATCRSCLKDLYFNEKAVTSKHVPCCAVLCRTHAADVLRTLHVIATRGGLLRSAAPQDLLDLTDLTPTLATTTTLLADPHSLEAPAPALDKPPSPLHLGVGPGVGSKESSKSAGNTKNSRGLSNLLRQPLLWMTRFNDASG